MTDDRAWKTANVSLADVGDMGGDIQADRTYSMRFLNETARNALIDVHVYATAISDDDSGHGNHPDPSESYGVQVLTQFLIFTETGDPWEDPEWSEEVYEFLPGKPTTIQIAKMIARQFGDWYIRGLLRPPAWDGKQWADEASRPQR
jgi:hypothetical protein